MDYIKTKSVYCISYITLQTWVMGHVEEDSVVKGDNIFVIENNEETWRAYKEYKAISRDSKLELWVDLNKLNRIIREYKDMTREFMFCKVEHKEDGVLQEGRKLLREYVGECYKTKDLCRELEDINKRYEEILER